MGKLSLPVWMLLVFRPILTASCACRHGPTDTDTGKESEYF